MFVVSLPYAVLHGGWFGVIVLVSYAYIACYTGKILVSCLYECNEAGELVRVRDSYVSIAKVVMGEKYGGKMVNIAQNIELLMTCILYIVLCGELMIGSFPEAGIDQASWMMISACILLPCAFLRDLHSVSMLSFWCGVSHIAINVIILGYCLLQIFDWHYSQMSFHLNMQTFPVTLGIVTFSYTSQIFLPTLEGNLRDRSKFHLMLDWSHHAAAAFKAIFALLGFLTFGQATQEVITNNLPTRGFKIFINLILAVKALLSYPLPYFASAGLIETTLFKRKPTVNSHPHGYGPQPLPSCWHRDGEYRVWAVALRVLLILLTLGMAVTIPHFGELLDQNIIDLIDLKILFFHTALLMGLIGNFTGTMLSFVWPCYFYMKLKWNQLSMQTIALNVFIIFAGGLSGLIGIIVSFNRLVDKYHLQIPHLPGRQLHNG